MDPLHPQPSPHSHPRISAAARARRTQTAAMRPALFGLFFACIAVCLSLSFWSMCAPARCHRAGVTALGEAPYSPVAPGPEAALEEEMDAQACSNKATEEDVLKGDLWERLSWSTVEGYPERQRRYLRLLALALTGSLDPDVGRCIVGSSCECGRRTDFLPARRACGNDWPVTGETMTGIVRLRNVARLLLRAAAAGVEGDFMETGVWRGGVCIFARALLDALGRTDSVVHVADAFDTIRNYDEVAQDYLSVSEERVRRSFEIYGMSDALRSGGVRTYRGLFRDTMPEFRERAIAEGLKIAVLRIDGNFFDSYQDVLYHAYEFVPVGGFVIFDDVMSHPPAMEAWNHFQGAHFISEDLVRIDLHSAYIQKTEQVTTDFATMRPPQDTDVEPDRNATDAGAEAEAAA